MRHSTLSSWRVVTLLVLIACASAACRSPLSRPVDPAAVGDGFVRVNHQPLPPRVGGEGCGSQALAVALAAFDPSIDPKTLSEELPWRDHGATIIELVAAARSRGFRVAIAKGSLERIESELKRGHVPLVLFDVQTQIWSILGWLDSRQRLHWAVVSGISDKDILFAGTGTSYLVSRSLFDERWCASSRCMLVVQGKADRK